MSALSQPATSQRHPLAVAVIGAGMAGRTHANAWRQVGTVFGSEGIPPIRLAAICDSYEPFARSARDSYGYERAVTDWHDIVDADDIDVVMLRRFLGGIGAGTASIPPCRWHGAIEALRARAP